MRRFVIDDSSCSSCESCLIFLREPLCDFVDEKCFLFKSDFGMCCGNLHAFDNFGATRQALAFASIAEVVLYFALAARSVPAKAAIRNRLEGNVLKTAHQRVVFRYTERLSDDFDLD